MPKCDHDDLVRVAGGWFCPWCKQLFAKKPERPVKVKILNTEDKKETPKKKR